MSHLVDVVGVQSRSTAVDRVREDRTSLWRRGKTVVVVGAGGAGRGLAFGAKFKGAEVIVANRSLERAQALAQACGG